MSNTLNLTKIRYRLTFERDVVLPKFIGNTLRGAIGSALVKLYCQKAGPDCMHCELNHKCPYAMAFKCIDRTEYVHASPNPYVIEFDTIPRRIRQGESIVFSLLLMGKATDFIMCFDHAIKYAVQNRFENRNYVMHIEERYDPYAERVLGFDELPDVIQWSDGMTAPDEIRHIKIRFLTPFQYTGQKYTELEFNDFCDRLFLRIADLCDIYSDSEFVLPYNFAIRKNKIEVIYDLKKIIVGQKDFNQPCSIGTVDYYGRLTRYMPYFALGSEIHFGRLATRGLGKYIIEEIH